ncbi:MAG: three-Cys-motif partner protein TcmP [Planctomycetota bacterium]|nr:three-Cys-motif partner protein TcmP [Planctomycetota bacterium]
MGADFFQLKRDWSRYKDLILEYYLKPYIAKVAKLGKPILIVDCFAGCGQFGDGKPGSPIIIAKAIQKWRATGTAISAEFIEADRHNYELLQSNLEPFGNVGQIRNGRFEDVVQELATRAQSETLFLYIDPYTVKGLDFAKMQAVYDQIRKSGASVEVLMNFNVATFMRWALAAQKRHFGEGEDFGDADYQADDPNERVEIATLNSIAGGDYWQEIAQNGLTFAQQLRQFATCYAQQLGRSFAFVCSYPVKSAYKHKVPKYLLIYATRSSHGLELMNDAMCNARQEFLGEQFPANTLFDLTPDHELSDFDELKTALVNTLRVNGPLKRKALRMKSLESFFCQFSKSQLNQNVKELLKARRLFSSTGKIVINDDVLLSAIPFQTNSSG